jgi:hypothetical protein
MGAVEVKVKFTEEEFKLLVAAIKLPAEYPGGCSTLWSKARAKQP